MFGHAIRIMAFVASGLVVALACAGLASAQSFESTEFRFESNGVLLSGRIDQPRNMPAQAIIVLIHGYGPTDIIGRDMYADLREAFTSLGIATVTWDKPGCGASEGDFDINQPVESSAQEVLDAISYLRAEQVPGAQKFGLWGVSRAGWIAPLAVSQDPSIDFWISVSGTTAEDNFFYLLMSNLPFEGGSVEEAELLRREWLTGYQMLREGQSYDAFLSATTHLRSNEYIRRMRGEWWTQQEYEAHQRYLAETGDAAPFHPETGQFIFVDNFEALLSGLDVDVLALFGDRDLNIDWRQTRSLYEATFGLNPDASLSVHVFEGADHNIHVSDTGSIAEMQARTEPPQRSSGYLSVQQDWLRRVVLSSEASDRLVSDSAGVEDRVGDQH